MDLSVITNCLFDICVLYIFSSNKKTKSQVTLNQSNQNTIALKIAVRF